MKERERDSERVLEFECTNVYERERVYVRVCKIVALNACLNVCICTSDWLSLSVFVSVSEKVPMWGVECG